MFFRIRLAALTTDDFASPSAPAPKPVRFDLSVHYHHTHSFQPDSAASVSLQEELTATKVAIRNKKLGVLVLDATPYALDIMLDDSSHTNEARGSLAKGQEYHSLGKKNKMVLISRY